VEEAIYESSVLQRLVEVDLGAAPAPDETTIDSGILIWPTLAV